MKPLIYLIAIFAVLNLSAQNVNKEIITLDSKQEKEILLPAFKGDTIRLNVNLHNTKKAKNNTFLFYEYPNKLLVKNENVKEFDKIILVQNNGIYKLVIKNDNTKMVDYNFNYSILSNRKKRPQIGYIVKKDTTYGFETDQYRDINIQETETIQNEKFYLNSTSNALLKGGKNRIIVPVNLPAETKEWYYIFTASRELKDINNTLSSFDLASQITKFIKEDQSIQNSINKLNPPPGANICDIYLINDEENAVLFKEKEDFKSSLIGSRENFKSGIVKIDGNTKSFLGIRNPDNLYGIHIAIEIIAVVEKTEKIKEKVHIPIITSYQVPYLVE
tara:strand:- start:15697 stop:16692 length:996 start_codon:yes stop_codon:yes gene_type:complete